MKATKLRALAATSPERTDGWQDTPTMAASGVPGFQVYEWNGLFAPAGTPADVLERLETETRAIVAGADIRKRFADLGVQAVGSSSREFADFLKAKSARWATLIRTVGIKAD
ncbi:tripartite-type tricarboxylate transporter receptor subunit TctC [Variovorax boronicumulans]|nr:tripartite-type tricarboxylate transporter receptor subunit TctC [Variovorax boronicumulans]MDQ0005258.1 tripartite-type tricarboxylate transporter receptor subunit TctC [Variovorax boronicumulans]MDQ0036659.1 tripartite-type tricarboxylate transporter receptor subunit TctC [Variovorax boronicumulans]